ncbi:MAG: DUF4062 domain-containing protein, partial [Planctomycetaceae bacterium]|nr:DUF4062 domain-containing protein [Planctomycetaceae bacterium]
MENEAVFISAVTGELGGERSHVATDLRTAEVTVYDQEYFRSKGGLLLQLLDDYIRKCAAVIHLVGARAGFAPKQNEVDFI